MSKSKRLVTIELDNKTVQILKEAVKAAKKNGVYMTQPLYLRDVILEHFKVSANE